jgi:hypothetical protein
MCLQEKVLTHYFTTKQYRIKLFFSGVYACVHGADALVHTLSAPFWEMVMLRKQYTLILIELYLNDHFCAVRAMNEVQTHNVSGDRH